MTDATLADQAAVARVAAGSETDTTATAGARRGPLLTPRRSNIILLLIAACLAPTWTNREMTDLFSQSFSLTVLYAVCFAMAALSLNLLTGYAGQISVGHAALLSTGAIVSGLVTSRAGWPMWLGIPVAAIATALVALAIGFPALRLRGLYLAMVTIAFGYMMNQFVFRIDWLTNGSAGVSVPRRMWGDTLLNDHAYMLSAALVLLIGMWVVDANVTRTQLGRAFRAIRENEAVAQSFGVDVRSYKLLAFAISGAMAGVAGAVYGHGVGFVNSETLPFIYSLDFIIIVIVGGLGSRAGVVIAAIAFQLFPSLVDAVNVGWLKGTAPIIGAAILMLTIARHPGGFAQMITEARERRAARAARAGRDDDEEPPIPALPSMPRPAQAVAAAPAGSLVLAARDITVRFGGVVAVDQASIEVRGGRIVGLIGPNGAGKTTLFNTISGLIRPESGAVSLLGGDISDEPPHRRARLGLGRTFQQIGLAKDQTILQNMLLAQHLGAGYGNARALLMTPLVAEREQAMEERARETIAALGFGGRENVPVRLLSHGQQRIVEVGCALLGDPVLLMLDEPSAGFSPAACENLAARLRELRDGMGHTVLLIEHNVPMVMDVCDEVYVLSQGRVIAHGTPDVILRDPEVVGAYLGEAVA